MKKFKKLIAGVSLVAMLFGVTTGCSKAVGKIEELTIEYDEIILAESIYNKKIECSVSAEVPEDSTLEYVSGEGTQDCETKLSYDQKFYMYTEIYNHSFWGVSDYYNGKIEKIKKLENTTSDGLTYKDLEISTSTIDGRRCDKYSFNLYDGDELNQYVDYYVCDVNDDYVFTFSVFYSDSGEEIAKHVYKSINIEIN